MAKRTTNNSKDKSKAIKAKSKNTNVSKVSKSAKPAATKKVTTGKAKKVTTKKTAASKNKSSALKNKKVTKSTKNSGSASSASNYRAPLSVKDALKKIKGYGKRDLAKFRKVIIEKRADIIKQLQALKDQMMDSSTGQYVNENSPYSLHMAEQGTDAQEREKLYLWAQRENKFLSYLDDALQRIENQTYGICIDSLNDPNETPHLVPKERLLAVPHTQHCVACKMKKDKTKR